MRIIRDVRRDRFAIINQQAINDERLSFRARGILVYLLDKPDNWISSSTKLSEVGTEGRDAIRTALAELEEVGYLRRKKKQAKKSGQWETVWIIRESPRTGFQASGSRRSDSQASL